MNFENYVRRKLGENTDYPEYITDQGGRTKKKHMRLDHDAQAYYKGAITKNARIIELFRDDFNGYYPVFLSHKGWTGFVVYKEHPVDKHGKFQPNKFKPIAEHGFNYQGTVQIIMKIISVCQTLDDNLEGNIVHAEPHEGEELP